MQTLYTKGQPFRWARLLMLLLLLPLAGRAQVVISQIYAGGGSGATGTSYKRDYVELFNSGTAAVNISGYAIQYAAAGAASTYTANAVTATPGTPINLQPGQYYTVVLGTPGTVGADITTTSTPAADYITANTSSSLSNSAGKIALTSNNTVLTASAGPAPPTSAALLDYVGFGTTASAYEGTGRAPVPTNTASALFRGSNGCKDTNDNAADFSNAAPLLRNMSTTLAPCSGSPTPAEINVKQGAATYLTGSTYSGFASTVVGSSDAKTFTIENLGGTVLNVSSITGSSEFSVSGAPTTVAANSNATTFTVTFTPAAAGTRTGTLTINSDDADEAAYVINLSATATASTPDPLIAVSQSGAAYANGSTYNGFPDTFVGSTSPAVSFTITNASSTDALTITGITTTGNFALSGTAPTTVPVGGTATFALTFTPTAAGTRTGTVTIANNSQGTPSYVINLSGNGLTPAPVLTAISPSNPVGGATYVVTLTGTNLGTTASTTVSFNGTTVSPTSVTGGGTTLAVSLPLPAAGGTFPITVTTAGGTSGPQSLTVDALPAGFFEPFEPGTQASYSTTGATVALRTGAYTFLRALLGNTTPPGDKFNNAQSVRMQGGGAVTMNFDKPGGAGVVTISAALYGSDAAASLTLEYSTDGGGTFLAAPGSPVALTAALTPYPFTLNVAGPVRLRIGTSNTSAGSNPRINVDDLQIADYTAAVCDAPTSLTPGSITSSSATVSFTASASAANGYTVTTTPATTTQTLAAGATSVSFSGLTPGTGYTVSIVSKCSATSTSSAATTSFTTLALAPTLAVTQSGTSYPSGGTAYNFGNQTVNTTSGAVSFTLTNSGPDALTISGITSTGDYAVSGTTPTTVPANGTATVSVTFTPTAAGTRTGTLVINSNATNGTTYTVNLTGNGQAVAQAPTLAVSQSGTSYPSNGTAYNFGNQTVGTTSPAVSFTLTNSGPDALTINGSNTTGDYNVVGTAPTTVPAGGTATVNVTFTPAATGTRPGTLVITSNATNGTTYTVNLTGNGQTATLPDLTVTTGTPTSPTFIAGNYNNVTITSTGNAALAGPLTVAGTLTIQGGGGLLQGGLGQTCQLLTGTGNFDLQAGGTLAICDPAGISPTGVPTGAILLTGTRTYSPLAQYIYTGNTAQITGLGLPSTVLALGVQNAAGVTLSKALSLTQGLNLNLGNLITSGQTFTLLSSNAGTAGVVNAGGVVVGTTTVQRSINSSNTLGYRHYSAPVSNTTFADLTVAGVFTPTFNSAYNNSLTPGTTVLFPTVFGYDQSRLATANNNLSAFDKGWFSPAGSGDPMVVGKGYTVNAPNTALVDFVGTLNNGSVPSGTLNRGADPAAGWHLLGNPYPSPLDWSTVAPAQRPGIDAAIYMFESAGQYGGSYRSYANGVGGEPVVVSSQGYFVRVTNPNGSGSVNLTNANRVTTFGTQPSFGRGTTDTRPQVALTLQGALVADAAYVYFQAGATAGRDAEFDATKLVNPSGLNLTSLAGGEDLAINGLPVLGTATVLVPLNVIAPQAGSYSLKADALANLTGTTVTLVDALTSIRTVLTAGTTYAFTLSSTTATGRFSLEFRPSGALATTAAQALSAKTQLFPNPASGSFRVQLPLLAGKTTVQATLTNALGQTVLSRTLNAAAGQAIDAEFDVRTLAAGVYTLRLNVNGTPVVRKVMVE